MTIKQYLDNLKALQMVSEPGKPPFIDTMMEHMDIWSNDACMGYCIKTMQKCGFDDDTIEKVVRAMFATFGSMSVEDAEQTYRNY